MVTDTNFSHQKIENKDDLVQFAQKVGFPQAGIILKFSNENSFFFVKDSSTLDDLIYHFESNQDKFHCQAETDMRAMNNPKRMQIISDLTQNLINRINSLCPNCQYPGFGEIEVKQGLPCEMCDYPTSSTLYYLQGCVKCSFTSKQMYPHKKTKESPMYCNYCNP